MELCQLLAQEQATHYKAIFTGDYANARATRTRPCIRVWPNNAKLVSMHACNLSQKLCIKWCHVAIPWRKTWGWSTSRRTLICLNQSCHILSIELPNFHKRVHVHVNHESFCLLDPGFWLKISYQNKFVAAAIQIGHDGSSLKMLCRCPLPARFPPSFRGCHWLPSQCWQKCCVTCDVFYEDSASQNHEVMSGGSQRTNIW